MRYKLLAALVFISCGLQAQQVNPVPDYVFQNRMSVGRTTVTDTLAYFSMGPRYGAIRGFMPPMVVDTALVTGGTKRNGLTIFSIQKNKYVYWDSVGSKWAEMAGTGGSAITGTGAAGYMSEFTTSTNLDSTTLYHSAGRFAIGSTTVSNGRFSVFGGQAYFDTSLKVGSQTFLADEGKNEVYLNTTTDAGAYALQVAGSIYNTTGAVLAASSGNVGINTTSASQKLQVKGSILADSSITATGDLKVLQGVTTGFFNNEGLLASHNGSLRVQMRYLAREHLFSSGQVEAAAIFVDSTANVGIGTSSPTSKLFVSGGDFNVSGGSIIASTPATANNTTKNMLALLAGTDTTNGATAFYIDLRHSTTGTNRRVDIYSADNTNYRNISFPYAKLLVGSTNDAGAYALQVTGAIYNTTTLTTGAPTSGSAKPWRLGEAATVSPTSPNRTIRVEIDGTVYYIHAKTTND